MQYYPPIIRPFPLTIPGAGDEYISIDLDPGKHYFVLSIQGVNRTRNGLKQYPLVVIGSSDAVSNPNLRFPIDNFKLQENDSGTVWTPLLWIQGYKIGVYFEDVVSGDTLYGYVNIAEGIP